MSRAALPQPGPGALHPSSGARRRWAAFARLGQQQSRPRPGRADPGGSRGRQVPPGREPKRDGRRGPHLGGDPLFPVSHGERISPDHRTFEARVRLAAGGCRTAAPREARGRARRFQDLAALRECRVVRRPNVRSGARGPLSGSFDDGATAARCDPRCDRRMADRIGRRRPGTDGVGGFALGRSDNIGNIGHADRADADGGIAGRRDLSAGIDAALAART